MYKRCFSNILVPNIQYSRLPVDTIITANDKSNFDLTMFAPKVPPIVSEGELAADILASLETEVKNLDNDNWLYE